MLIINSLLYTAEWLLQFCKLAGFEAVNYAV